MKYRRGDLVRYGERLAIVLESCSLEGIYKGAYSLMFIGYGIATAYISGDIWNDDGLEFIGRVDWDLLRLLGVLE